MWCVEIGATVGVILCVAVLGWSFEAPRAEPRFSATHDRDTADQIRVAIGRELAGAASADIEIRVRRGVVRLNGSVGTLSARTRAAVAAGSHVGVLRVDNRLKIRTPQHLASTVPLG